LKHNLIEKEAAKTASFLTDLTPIPLPDLILPWEKEARGMRWIETE